MDGPLDNFGKIFKGIRIIFHRYNRQCCRTSHAHRKRVLFFPAFVSKNIKAIPYKKNQKQTTTTPNLQTNRPIQCSNKVCGLRRAIV